MASIMEDFISTLEQEEKYYVQLLEVVKRKTPVIVKGDLEGITAITREEQPLVDKIGNLDKHRLEVLTDISIVLNKKEEDLTIPNIISLLQKQPAQQKQLSEVYDRLRVVISEMKRINEQNKNLIELSLDMVQFDLDLIRASKKAPETNDYTKRGGYSNAGLSYERGYSGGAAGGFDAKQ